LQLKAAHRTAVLSLLKRHQHRAPYGARKCVVTCSARPSKFPRQ
jgi:hypothetical protein